MRISDWSSDVCSSDLLDPETSRNQRSACDGSRHPGPDSRPGRSWSLDRILGERPRVGQDRSPTICGDRGDRDRKSVVSGKSVSVRVDIGGRRSIIKKNKCKLIAKDMSQKYHNE